MSTEVFVSYSSQDYERVMPLVDRLRSTGIAVWVDEGNIDAATLWSESIVEAIAECCVLIMMVSSHSTGSHNVVKEVMIASEGKKTILPIYLEPAEIPAKLKYQLTGIQHLEWFDGGNDEIFETLKDGLLKHGVTIDGKAHVHQAPNLLSNQKQPHRSNRLPSLKNQFSFSKKNIALAVLTLTCVMLLAMNFIEIDSNKKKSAKKQPFFLPVSIAQSEKFHVDLSSQYRRNIAISPDGKWIAYISGPKANSSHTLWLHSTKDNTRSKLAISQSMRGLYDPFFSHDNRWLAIFDDGKLKRFSTETHEMNIICDESSSFGGAWGDNNVIYFTPHNASQIQEVRVNSSNPPKTILSLTKQNKQDDDYAIHGSGRIDCLPKEQGILFTDFHGAITANYGTIVHMDLKSKRLTPLIYKGCAPKYSSTGHIIYIRDNSLKARHFDISTLSIGSEEVTLLSGIQMNQYWGNAQYSISQEGTLVFIPGNNTAKGQFAWIDRSGLIDRIEQFKANVYTQADLNSTGKKIATTIAGERMDILILDTAKGSTTQITTKDSNWMPIWSPDDSAIVFEKMLANSSGNEIVLMNSDGTGVEKKLFSRDTFIAPDDWSQDGTKIAVTTWPSQIGYLNMHNESIDLKILAEKKDSSIFEISFSPNGKWITYSSSEAGGHNCYIAPIDNPDNAYLVSDIYPGVSSSWSPKGDEIFYYGYQGMFSTPLKFDENGGVEIGKPTLLFDTSWITHPGIGYAVHPNGKKFLAVVHEDEDATQHFNIVLNFDVLIEQKFAELKNNNLQ